MSKFSKGPWTVSEFGSQVVDANQKVILEAAVFSADVDKLIIKNNVKLASLSYEMFELLNEITKMNEKDLFSEQTMLTKIDHLLNKLK